jgi:heterodisulfide reductase subunit A-like polyferredoxin
MAGNKPKDSGRKTGAVLVVGGGSRYPGGAGFGRNRILCVSGGEKTAIGVMPQLDKTFPPTTVPCAPWRRNWWRWAATSILEILALAEVTGIEGQAGNYQVEVL